MHRSRGTTGWISLMIAIGLAGCTPVPDPLPDPAPVAIEPIGFDGLGIVLAATVDEAGAIDPTALAVQLPRLDRQVAVLAGPWPADARRRGSDVRLAWLYNARMAWSLRIVARDLMLTGVTQDRYTLSETVNPSDLLETKFVLDGAAVRLGDIDRELATYDDVRIACIAPGATDFDGRLAGEPFAGESVRSTLAARFVAYLGDDRRVIVDHAARRLRIPPRLYRVRERLISMHNRRFSTTNATLATALRVYLEGQGRRRMGEAVGYAVAARRGRAGVTVSGGRRIGSRR